MVRSCRERSLAKVKVAAADIKLLMEEMGLEKGRADRILREQGGDASKALSWLLNDGLWSGA